MLMRLLTSLLLAVLLAAGPSPASAQSSVDLSGPWVFTMDSPEGTTTFPFMMQQEGNDLAVLAGQGPEPQVLFRGTASGESVRFFWELNYNGMPLQITLNGALREGRLAGEADFSGLAQGSWSAQRPSSPGGG